MPHNMSGDARATDGVPQAHDEHKMGIACLQADIQLITLLSHLIHRLAVPRTPLSSFREGPACCGTMRLNGRTCACFKYTSGGDMGCAFLADDHTAHVAHVCVPVVLGGECSDLRNGGAPTFAQAEATTRLGVSRRQATRRRIGATTVAP